MRLDSVKANLVSYNSLIASHAKAWLKGSRRGLAVGFFDPLDVFLAGVLGRNATFKGRK